MQSTWSYICSWADSQDSFPPPLSTDKAGAGNAFQRDSLGFSHKEVFEESDRGTQHNPGSKHSGVNHQIQGADSWSCGTLHWYELPFQGLDYVSVWAAIRYQWFQEIRHQWFQELHSFWVRATFLTLIKVFKWFNWMNHLLSIKWTHFFSSDKIQGCLSFCSDWKLTLTHPRW